MSNNTLSRKYPGSDANLLQEANLNKTLLNDNLAVFTAEDSTIDAAYVTAYEADITDAEETVSDEQVEAVLQGKTETVRLAEKAVGASMKRLFYYVREAFPTDEAVQHEFGLDRWDKARDSQDATLRFLSGAHLSAVKYQTQLTAVGFTAARTTAIDTARQAMEDADNDQEHYRSGRPKLSALRVTEFNEVYDRITRINALAQIVFADDPEMASQFVFNPSGSGSDSTSYDGIVAALSEVTIATVSYGASKEIRLKNTGTTPLSFSLREDENVSAGTPITVAPSGDETHTMAELNASATATFLVVANTAEEVVGGYEVTVED